MKLYLILYFCFLPLRVMCQTDQETLRPDSIIPISFQSQVSVIRGLFYKASGTGPFPTVILCPGFPGNNADVLGLGAYLMKEGINVLFFNYRGTWGSEGMLTIPNTLEDVISAIHYVKSSFAIQTFKIDTSNITIIGYSYGGSMALLGSLSDSTIKRVVDIAGGDLTVVASMMKTDVEYRLAIENLLEQGISSSGFTSINGKDLFNDVFNDMDKYSLVKHSKLLSYKDIFLIGGWDDQTNIIEYHLLPLYRTLKQYGTKQLKIEILPADHSFMNVRNQLSQIIITWIERN